MVLLVHRWCYLMQRVLFGAEMLLFGAEMMLFGDEIGRDGAVGAKMVHRWCRDGAILC